MTELKKVLQEKILEFEKYRTDPNYQSEMEQNAVLVTLRELKYMDQIAEIEQSHKLPVMRPASASAVGGELLPAEGSAKGVSVCKDNTRHKDGPCKYKIGSCDDCQTP